MRGVGFGARLEDGAWSMLRRSIDSEQLHRRLAGIDEVVACPCGNKVQTIRGDSAFLAIQNGLTLSADEDKRLIHIRMNLFADILTGSKAHQNDLTMSSSSHLTAEVFVLFRQRDDVVVETHSWPPFSCHTTRSHTLI